MAIVDMDYVVFVSLCVCAPPQALAPASTQAVGARSWAQASVTHGTQGDGESSFFYIAHLSLE